MKYETSLPPSFMRFLTEAPDAKSFEYYTGPFEHYESSLLVKHAVSSDVAALQSIITGVVGTAIEIGAGTGRVTKVLSGCFDRIIALEKSFESCVKLKSEFDRDETIEIKNQDFMTFSIPEKSVAIVLSSLSINLFTEEDIDGLLERCAKLLIDGGSFYFGCLDSSSLNDFEKYNGKVGSSTSLDHYLDDEGEPRVMITNTMYIPDQQLLMQNWLVDLHGSKKYPQFCFAALDETLWTIESLSPYLESWGFSLKSSDEFRIQGGGGDGLLARMYRCTKDH
jgi:Methyltransferase domain